MRSGKGNAEEEEDKRQDGRTPESGERRDEIRSEGKESQEERSEDGNGEEKGRVRQGSEEKDTRDGAPPRRRLQSPVPATFQEEHGYTRYIPFWDWQKGGGPEAGKKGGQRREQDLK
ncbi:hypothetical protein NDU88_001990 [Pleurodeles waltl]|uniref:Uncharacterized protein n=1 Tax=Pleurodeles waltl TaxID=8319 RepID=A0AAV7VYD7_PLEWA|nr:hypothetical protein NDU88_001990 [Pleurodeles waltl]